MKVIRTTILRGIVAVGLAALTHAALAQFVPQRPSEGVPIPPTSAPQAAPVQTPTITNAPTIAVPQKPAAIPQQQPGISDQRPQIFPPLPARPERNEFQDFIEQSTGKRLPIFGEELFEGAPSTFAPIENIAVPANYVIGPGDELQIRAWGQIDVDYRAVVDRNGIVNVPRVGSVSVAAARYRAIFATSRCWLRSVSSARCRSSSSATRADRAATP